MSEAKGLRESMNAARKLAEALRNVLPSSREAGRVRKKGEEPADVQTLLAMKVANPVLWWCMRLLPSQDHGRQPFPCHTLF